MKKYLSLVFLSLLIISLIACSEIEDFKTPADSGIETPTDTQIEDIGIWKNAIYKNETTLGEGSKTVTVTVKVNEHSVKINVRTDADTLGKALVDVGLIEGDQSQYGLYITKVNGITADFSADSAFWSLEREGVQTPTGVDSTAISDNDVFELVYTVYNS